MKKEIFATLRNILREITIKIVKARLGEDIAHGRIVNVKLDCDGRLSRIEVEDYDNGYGEIYQYTRGQISWKETYEMSVGADSERIYYANNKPVVKNLFIKASEGGGSICQTIAQ